MDLGQTSWVPFHQLMVMQHVLFAPGREGDVFFPSRWSLGAKEVVTDGESGEKPAGAVPGSSSLQEVLT